MNNKAGGAKARATLIAKYGSEEAYRAHMTELSKSNTNRPGTGGFASNKPGADGLTGPQRARVSAERRRAPSKDQ